MSIRSDPTNPSTSQNNIPLARRITLTSLDHRITDDRVPASNLSSRIETAPLWQRIEQTPLVNRILEFSTLSSQSGSQIEERPPSDVGKSTKRSETSNKDDREVIVNDNPWIRLESESSINIRPQGGREQRKDNAPSIQGIQTVRRSSTQKRLERNCQAAHHRILADVTSTATDPNVII